MTIHHVKKSLLIVFMIGAVVLAASGYADHLVDAVGMGRITDANLIYLNDAFDRSLAGFLVLSGIKSGLAIIEGSEVGIGFNLEIGDIVQAVYDYVDVAWKAALAGGTILLMTRMCLEAVALIDHWCLAAMLLGVGVFLIFRWFLADCQRMTQVVRESTMFLVVLTLILYVILPISITGASFLSKRITQPIIEETQTGFEDIHREFSPGYLSEGFFPEDVNEGSLFPGFDFKAKYESTKERIQFIGTFFKDRTRHMAVLTLKLVAGYVFDCIIFPLTFFVVLYLFTKNLVNFLSRAIS
ncbi:MAG: hypothetical protein DRH90_03945 [Deltaproteobacteria bacterium]|nr:MAG: hypothetical protein DRH90_03945 [Deltaproteobacteria bacterium]RLC15252.1 MAG: hypothetical protein DRI24_11430 [Deltaproteobacteria bacterium]